MSLDAALQESVLEAIGPIVDEVRRLAQPRYAHSYESAADALDVSPSTVKQLVRDGRLVRVEVGMRRTIIPAWSLQAFARTGDGTRPIADIDPHAEHHELTLVPNPTVAEVEAAIAEGRLVTGDNAALSAS